MNEKVYKTMTRCGAGSIAVGIIVLVTGITTGPFNAGKRSKIIKKKVRNYILMCRTNVGGGKGSPVFALF